MIWDVSTYTNLMTSLRMRKNASSLSNIRLGLVGLGSMGRHHAQSVLDGKIPRCQLTAVCDIDPERLRAYPKLATFHDYRDLIRSGTVDALLIATPHYSHTPIGIAAFKAGLHVLMEKPISVHKADAQRLITAYKKVSRQVVFAAMFNQRTDPHYQKIRELVQRGELGDIQRIQWTITDWFRSQAYYNSGGWRATWKGEGGGVLINQCVHNIDLFQWIFGMPNRVRALCRIGRYHDIEVEDEVTATFEYTDGPTATLITSTGEAPGVNRLEIAADRGRLTLESGTLTYFRNEVPTSHHLRTTSEGYEPPKAWKVEIPITGTGEQHVGILRNFTNAILDGEPLLAPGVEGIHSVELINAMILSSFKESPVKLPFPAAEYEKLLQKLIRKSTFKKKVRRYRGGSGNYLVDC